jgi:uncharacterized protein DUF4383
MNDRTLAQKLALLFGAVFLLAGVAGFIPGLTTNLYDGLEFAGEESTAELLGIFQVSILHNIIHLLFGVGILMAATHAGALAYLLWSGVLYVVVFLLGLVGGGDWVPIDNADDLLHAVLAVGLLGAYFVAKKADEPAMRTA